MDGIRAAGDYSTVFSVGAVGAVCLYSAAFTAGAGCIVGGPIALVVGGAAGAAGFYNGMEQADNFDGVPSVYPAPF